MNILSLTFENFKKKMQVDYGRDMYISGYVYREILKYRNRNLNQVKKISWDHELVGLLDEDLKVKLPEIIEELKEEDVIKFVSGLSDGETIESVIIPMFSHHTLCISSQVGCRMGCRFCVTAGSGFKRNLEIHEITGQLYLAEEKYGMNIQNIVFMGMGEPFDNFDHVMEAVKIFNDPRGFDIPLRRMTLSTCGLVDGIEKLKGMDELRNLNLAISLNAPNDEIRSLLMPVNRKYNMAELKKALLTYPVKGKEAFFMEYVLIKGVNDRKEHALELVEYLKPLHYMINLIPCNHGSESRFESPDEEDMERFRSYLIDEKVTVRRRATRGREVMAACGQLRGRYE